MRSVGAGRCHLVIDLEGLALHRSHPDTASFDRSDCLGSPTWTHPPSAGERGSPRPPFATYAAARFAAA